MQEKGRETLHAFLIASNILTRTSEIIFERFGISPAQFNALNLAALKGGTISQKELVENLLVGKASVSILLSRMVRDGLIMQKPDKKDLRKSIITLTAKGRAVWKKAVPEYGKAIQNVFSDFTAQDLEKFQKLLQQLTRSIQQNIQE